MREQLTIRFRVWEHLPVPTRDGHAWMLPRLAAWLATRRP